ncbi:cytochrome aa3 quinol oxidase subunit II [Halobacillus salinarum]|uniref:Quinol oxidase subunit 2 n=2 Tax=Halobacillus salinarum TaxID=2932257 RepID=A0ABY4ER88_9BACI|nr:cytochrome aa3 quinol oxidase subunit II [Halobacillus salinarum]UOQ46422.1 cytochrome aa3 quinol oxidase subunit II [Halobacillus salinarum]
MSGCSALPVLNPKGPVADAQKDLIYWSIILMLIIVAAVFVLFTIMLVKYRERKKDDGRDPEEIEGNTWLEILWTAIPIVIVILLAWPTVTTIYSLEKVPESSTDKDPLVIRATSADWKWFFSYPEQGIETVNYLHIPEDRAVKFVLTSADSMAALWIPQLGGQEYNMAGMKNELYLQADHPGVYNGRNANFTGEGFNDMTFKVHADTAEDFKAWVKDTKQNSPKLSQDKYNHLLLKGDVKTMAFSSTHLQFVDHAKQPDYAVKVRKKLISENPELQEKSH